MKFALVRMIENPATYRYFNGYVTDSPGHFKAMDHEGVCTIEPVTDWEPTDGHGTILEWPPVPLGHRAGGTT